MKQTATSDRRPRTRWVLGLAGSAVFLVAAFLYVLVRVDPALIYHHFVGRFHVSDWRDLTGTIADFHYRSAPLSIADRPAAGFLSYPGGPVELASAWLSEHYWISWLGAAVIAVTTWLVCVATDSLVAALGGRRNHPLSYAAGIVLLLLYNRFGNPLFLALGALTALLAANVYFRLTASGAWKRTAAFVLLSASVWWIAGAAYFLFAVLCAVFEMRHGRRFVLGAVCLVLAIAVPYAGTTYLMPSQNAGPVPRLLPFLVDEDGSLRLPVPYARGLVTVGPDGTVSLAPTESFWTATTAALVITGAAVLAVALQRRRDRAARGRAGARTRWWHRLGETRMDWLAVPVLMSILGGILILPGVDDRWKGVLRIDLCSEEERWDDLLRVAALSSRDTFVAPIQHDVIRALYETGRLGDELFAWPVEVDGLILLDHERAGRDMLKPARTAFRIGRVNEAERMAQNWLESFGDRPVLLRLLARINVAKGRTRAAEAHLRVLRKYHRCRAWADSLLKRLKSDPLLESDAEMTRVRQAMFDEDGILMYGGRSPEDRWLAPLEHHPRNRMAFEYLMTFYLLTLQIDKVAANVHRLDDFDYGGIPRHYEEAVLIYEYKTDKKIDLRGRRIRAETRMRFEAFLRELARCRAMSPADQRAGARELAETFGDTYFYYFIF